MVEGGTTLSDPIRPDIETSDTVLQSQTAPSMGKSGAQLMQQMNKEEGYNDDILCEGETTSRNDCDIRKRKLWCNKHECGVKTYDVSSTK